jgi:hypothetical protein
LLSFDWFRPYLSPCLIIVQGDDLDPTVSGIQNILSAYYGTLGQVTLSGMTCSLSPPLPFVHSINKGPTHFSKVINKAIELTNADKKKSQPYTVLLILTDGCIKDMVTDQSPDVDMTIVLLSLSL